MTDWRQISLSLQTPELSQVIWSLSLGSTVVSTMFVRIDRAAVTALWFIALALLVLLWTPPSLAVAVLTLLVGLACPAAILLLWNQSHPTLAVAANHHD
jgi:hypothetical protein